MDDVPDALQALVRERLRAVEDLEALLLVRSQPGRWWSDAEVATELRVSPPLAGAALRRLVQSGFCKAAGPDRGPTRFDPDTAELGRATEELVGYYAHHRVEVLVLISRSAISRVRSDALRTFAEAFRVKDRKEDA